MNDYEQMIKENEKIINTLRKKLIIGFCLFLCIIPFISYACNYRLSDIMVRFVQPKLI